MNNRQARKTGRTILCCGCIMVALTAIPVGVAMIVIGVLVSLLLGRCPHCGKMLPFLPPTATVCPKCHKPLDDLYPR